MEKAGILAVLTPLHALINIAMALTALAQFFIGLQIRRLRKAADPVSPGLGRLHRRLGAALVISCFMGLFSGWLVVFNHYSALFVRPIHSLTGLGLALVFFLTFAVSNKIRVGDSGFRKAHYGLGYLVISFCAAQIYLGLSLFLRLYSG
jgi:hypothetical protein